MISLRNKGKGRTTGGIREREKRLETKNITGRISMSASQISTYVRMKAEDVRANLQSNNRMGASQLIV